LEKLEHDANNALMQLTGAVDSCTSSLLLPETDKPLFYINDIILTVVKFLFIMFTREQ
jgi:hypothetical protein